MTRVECLYHVTLVTLLIGSAVASTSPPTIETSANKKTARPGDLVQLECHATGYPTPNISWYRTNQVIHQQIIQTLVSFNFSASRYSFTASVESGGDYVCQATNRVPDRHGNFIITKTVHITIEGLSTTPSTTTYSSRTTPSKVPSSSGSSSNNKNSHVSSSSCTVQYNWSAVCVVVVVLLRSIGGIEAMIDTRN